MGGGRTNVVLFGLLWFSAVWIHQSPKNPNAASRLDLLHAVTTQGTWQIDAYHANTTNKANWQGHYYSDKPPGIALLALPIFFVLRLLLGTAIESDPGWLVSSWLACAFTKGVVQAIGGIACFSWLQRWTPSRAALLATLGVFLGSPIQAYASSWFPHATVVSLTFVALWLTPKAPGFQAHEKDFGAKTDTKRWAAAGVCCGLAWSSEYSAALPLAAVGLTAWRRPGPALVAFALGWVPAMFIVGGYHWLCFGTPFTIAYRHATHLIHMQDGVYGIHFPPPVSNLIHLLISPARGLLVWSPLLLLLLPGWRTLYRRASAWFYLTYTVALLHWILLSGYADVTAGSTVGPRLLLCVWPWLALPAALALAQLPRLGTALLCLSYLINTSAAWSGLKLPAGALNPLCGIIPHRLASGDTAHHVGEWLGIPTSVSATIYFIAQAGAILWLCSRTRPPSRTPPITGPTIH